VRKLDEKMDSTAASRVVLRYGVQILKPDISPSISPRLFCTHHLNSLQHDHSLFSAESKQAADTSLDGCDLAERVVEHGQHRRRVGAFCGYYSTKTRVAFHYSTQAILERDGVRIRRCDGLCSWPGRAMRQRYTPFIRDLARCDSLVYRVERFHEDGDLLEGRRARGAASTCMTIEEHSQGPR
jgi:hypothetical protein